MNTSYAMLDHGLGEDLDMLRDVVYKFAQAEIAPRAVQGDALDEERDARARRGQEDRIRGGPRSVGRERAREQHRQRPFQQHPKWYHRSAGCR